MFITHESKWQYSLTKARQFYDVECPLEGHALRLAIAISDDAVELNHYLEQVYALKRQGASTDGVPLPLCLSGGVKEPEQEPEQQVTTAASSKKSRKEPKLTE